MYEDVKIEKVITKDTCIIIKWYSPCRGWGEYSLYIDPDGIWHIDSEYMSREFGKYLFTKWLEGAIED